MTRRRELPGRFCTGKALLAAIILCCGARSEAGDLRYPVSAISAGLRKEADAVIRRQEVLFEVRDAARARLKITRAVTIFTKEGRRFGAVELSYGRFRSIEELDGRVYDTNGKEVARLEKRDTHDFSNAGSDLYADERVRTAELYYDSYPYTVEFTYEFAYTGMLSWPSWYPQESDEAVEYSRFELTLPDTGKLRYWTNRDSVPPVVSVRDDRRTYLWEARNLPELDRDMLDEDLDRRTVIVLTAPSSFQLEDYPGDMTSWQTFGQWYKDLHKDRTFLPEAARSEVHQLILPADSLLQRVRKVYAYMQGRTRYVSVQLGIGGWQAFDPTYVHTRGYGDCKALSNYTVALLREAGVPAYPVLIRGGSRRVPFYENFPSQQFNHEIVCVPSGKDTLWLECTSQTLPPGRTTAFNEDRYALLIGDNGGTLVRTPRSTSRENAQRRLATVTLVSGGDARARVRTTYTGDQHDQVRLALGESTQEDRERWLQDEIRIANCRLDSFSVQGLETRQPELTIGLQLTLAGYASATGSRIFFQPNLMERRTTVPHDSRSRLSPVRLAFPYLDSDSVSYRLPAGFVCEALPKDVSLRNDFGSYSATSTLRGDSMIVYTRLLDMRETTIPPARYQDYRRFFSDVVKSDRTQAVLVRKK
jgi:transglutaminase-like putative cysteine protease